MRVWEMAGVAAVVTAAMVGAGFASGREIVVFFARFGWAGYGGAALASALMGLSVRGLMLLAARARSDSLPELMRSGLGRSYGSGALMAAMLLTVASAMTAAGGELGALLVNVQGARQLGMALTAAVAAAAALRGLGALRALGWLTVLAALLYYAVLAGASPGGSPAIAWRPGAALAAVAYAGFNVSTACGVICAAGRRLEGDARRQAGIAGALTGGMMLALLALALACMRLHWADIEHAPLPSVLISARLGLPGYYGTIAFMWIAVMSTLAGVVLALRLQAEAAGLPGRAAVLCALSAAVLVGCLGFETLVITLYPALGLVLAAYLAALLLTEMRKGRGAR